MYQQRDKSSVGINPSEINTQCHIDSSCLGLEPCIGVKELLLLLLFLSFWFNLWIYLHYVGTVIGLSSGMYAVWRGNILYCAQMYKQERGEKKRETLDWAQTHQNTNTPSLIIATILPHSGCINKNETAVNLTNQEKICFVLLWTHLLSSFKALEWCIHYFLAGSDTKVLFQASLLFDLHALLGSSCVIWITNDWVKLRYWHPQTVVWFHGFLSQHSFFFLPVRLLETWSVSLNKAPAWISNSANTMVRTDIFLQYKYNLNIWVYSV